MRKAVGSNFDTWNGGAFGAAVQADESDTAIEHTFSDINPAITRKPVLFTDDGRSWFNN